MSTETATTQLFRRALADLIEALETKFGRVGFPGHSHRIAGRWDFDGRVCEQCQLWERVNTVVEI